MSTALAGPRRGLAIWLIAALTVAALGRAAFNGHATVSAFVAGSAFGIVLLAVAAAAGWRPAVPRLSSLVVGSLGGLVLIAIARLAHPFLPSVVGMRPEPFVVWGLVTALVVLGEEVLLRGALFDAVGDGRGHPLTAVLVTSVAFALMHVPLYGWQVVPLDVGVGIFFGGLRLATGGVGAPFVAHLVADLSTWWL